MPRAVTWSPAEARKSQRRQRVVHGQSRVRPDTRQRGAFESDALSSHANPEAACLPRVFRLAIADLHSVQASEVVGNELVAIPRAGRVRRLLNDRHRGTVAPQNNAVL